VQWVIPLRLFFSRERAKQSKAISVFGKKPTSEKIIIDYLCRIRVSDQKKEIRYYFCRPDRIGMKKVMSIFSIAVLISGCDRRPAPQSLLNTSALEPLNILLPTSTQAPQSTTLHDNPPDIPILKLKEI
jgi:hypothetical protein